MHSVRFALIFLLAIVVWLLVFVVVGAVLNFVL